VSWCLHAHWTQRPEAPRRRSKKGGVSQGSGLMSGRFIVHAIAVIGWLFAAVFAYAFLMLFGYFGVGFYGLLVLFICMQVELEPDGVSHRQRSPGIGFFKILGVGLTVIGFGGFLYFQLD
jgi:O-antigen/teichoic acid export membrane protein